MSRFTWPRLGFVPSIALLGALMAEGALKGFVNSEAGPLRGWIIALYLGGWTSAWLSYPMAKLAVASAPPVAGRWGRFAAHHLVGYAACACVCLLASRALRALVTRALGITLPAPTWFDDYLASVHLHTTFYAGLVFALSAAAIADERDRLSLRAVEHDAALSMRREETVASVVDLEQLTGTLRAVRQRLDHDVRDAERLTQRLADLLRDALSTGDSSWTLGREHQHVSRFLEVSRARAPRELVLDWSVPADLERCHVTRFSVKNAVSDVLSGAPAVSPLRVSVEARGRDDARHLVVRGSGVEREVTLAVAESHGA